MSDTPEQPPSPQPEDASPPAPSDGQPPPLPPLPYPGAPPLDQIIRAAQLQRGSQQQSGQPMLKSPRATMEKYDERCWTRTRQTNARRALGREPQTTMFCYINFRNALADLVPVPGAPASFLARDATTDSPDAEKAKKGKGKAPEHEDLPDYRWPALEGRYIYIARGREAVARHMKEMGGVSVAEPVDGQATGPKIMRRSGEEEKMGAWDTIARIEERCEKLEAQKLLPGKREEQMLRRAMGLDEDDSERLISLSDYHSTSLRRFHAHLLRIYTPAFTQLARLPATFTDGTQLRMLDTLTTRLTDGSAFTLAERLYTSFWNVQDQLAQRRKRRIEAERNSRDGDGGMGGLGGFGGFGGSQPPLPPLPPNGAARIGGEGAVESEGGQVQAEPLRPPGKEDWVKGSNGRLYPPNATVISCTVM